MKVLCLLSLAVHERSSREMPSPIDLKAIALAKQISRQITYLHVGEASTAVEEYLGYDLGEIKVIESQNIQAAIEQFLADNPTSVVVMGQRSLAGSGSGMLPYQLAKSLDYPVLANVLEAGNKVVYQYLPAGNRRELAIPNKAIITVHESSPLAVTYSHADRVAGEISVVEQQDVVQEGVDAWSYEPAKTSYKRLSLKSTKSGLERMRSAVEVTSKGGEVVRSGSAQEKAQRILEVLKANNLMSKAP